jgi:SPRY domain-containing SOCS box protein 3
MVSLGDGGALFERISMMETAMASHEQELSFCRTSMAECHLQFDCVKRTQIQKVGRGFVARQHASRLRHLASIVKIQCHVRGLVAKNVRATRAHAATTLLLVVRGFTHKALFSRKRKAATTFQAAWRGHHIRLPMLFPKLARAHSKLGAENQDLEAQKWGLEEEKRGLEQQLAQQLEAGMVALEISESRSTAVTWGRHSSSVTTGEGGQLATKTGSDTTTSAVFGGKQLTKGVHYMEVQLGGGDMSGLYVGITRPGLTTEGTEYAVEWSQDAWLMGMYRGRLFGNGKQYSDPAGKFVAGDKLGVLVDLDKGSLLFFKNGKKHGPGYGAGSVTGPVVLAVQMQYVGQACTVLPNAVNPLSLSPIVHTWTSHSPKITVSEEGRLAIKMGSNGGSMAFGGQQLTRGMHYMEVQVGGQMSSFFVGIARPGLSTEGSYHDASCKDAWLMCTSNGGLFGNGKQRSDRAGAFKAGDRLGMLVDLDKGSLLFFKNGEQHGPGYGAGSVTEPVVLAVEMVYSASSCKVLPNAVNPLSLSPIVHTWTSHSPQITVSKEGRLATKTTNNCSYSMALSGQQLTRGVHYMEVQLGGGMSSLLVGIARPGLSTEGFYGAASCKDMWLMHAPTGSLFGNGKSNSDGAGAFKAGDRLGILVDLDKGSLLFFKNGKQHGPGYGAGLVTGPVVLAAKMYGSGSNCKVLTNAAKPSGY